MKHPFLLLLTAAWAVCQGAFAQTSWTISVASSGTRGGYFETADGASQHAVPFSTTWPSGGLVPTFYVHFPAGTFSVTSANTVSVSVRDMTSGTDLLLNVSASRFQFTAPQEGWYRLRLSGGTAGTTVLSDFTVAAVGTPTGLNTNVWLADWRPAPSLHLNGFGSTNTQMPSGNAFDWAYDEVQIPADADFLGTYVESMASFGWYMGIQNNGSNGGTANRTVIFSAWDSGDTDSDPTLADFKRSGVLAHGEADDVTAERFGGEGTGTHIMLNGNLWRPGQWVRFLVNTRPEQISLADGSVWNNTLLSAWYRAEGIDTGWHYIGTLRQAGTVNYINPYNAFLEEYTRGNTSQGNQPHKAYYRRIFTRSMQSGTWYNRNSFWFSHTDGTTDSSTGLPADGARFDTWQGAVADYDGEPAMYMQSGGYRYAATQTGETSIPYLQPEGIVPTDAELQQLIDRDLLPAMQQQDEQRMQTAIDQALTQTASTGWTVAASSSEETVGEGTNGRASQAVDGDETTYWHTAWYWSSSSYPHSLTLLHDGEVTLDQIRLALPSGRGTDYTARTVTVSASADGSTWNTVGIFDIGASDRQTIQLPASLTTSRLRLDFTQGNGQQFLVVGEITFWQKDLAALQALAQSYLDGVDRFNGYDSTDSQTALLLSYVRQFMNDYEALSAALTALSKGGKLLKYGEVTEVASLSAEKVYYITNAYGYGAMAAPSASAAYPTLRNAQPESGSGQEADCKDVYKAAMPVQDPLAGWRILTSETYPGYYYLYNAGAGKYLNFANRSTLSDTPVPTLIRRSGRGFVFSLGLNPGTYDYLCAAPQFEEGQALANWTTGDEGSQWYIYDNFSQTPDLLSELTEALRDQVSTASHQEEYRETGIVVSLKGRFATFASDSDLEFPTDNDAFGAYAATACSGGVLTMSKVGEAQRGTGLVLYGDPGDYEVPYTVATRPVSGNLLVGVIDAATLSPTSGDHTNYILVNGTQGTGFYPLSAAGTLAAGKAYLSLPTADVAGVKALGMQFGNVVTAIPSAPAAASRAAVHDLSGRRVPAPAGPAALRPGVYLVGGRKVVVP